MMCIIFTEIKMIQLENMIPQRDSTVLKREWLQESPFFLAAHDASLGLQVLIFLCNPNVISVNHNTLKRE